METSAGAFQIRDILPHIALPLTLLASLFCPPFPGRRFFCAAAIIVTNWACALSPWPPNTGASRGPRYGLASSWILVLPVIERVLLHVPERDFWRIQIVDEEVRDDKAKEIPRSPPMPQAPPEFSWAKLRWAMALVSTPRGVGWNIGSKTVNAQREAIHRSGISRLHFIGVRLLHATVAYVGLDAVLVASRAAIIPEQLAWDRLVLARMVYLEFLMMAVVYFNMTFQYEFYAAIAVALHLNKPEDWPPLFGSIVDCYTTANVWGKFWHGYLRQPALGFSHFIVRCLCIPKRSSYGYFIHLATAFILSLLVHVVSIFSVSEGFVSFYDLVVNMAVFFLTQPLAVMAEILVTGLYERLILPTVLREGKEVARRDIRTSERFQKAATLFARCFGYLWVFCWLTFIGWWFVKVYIDIRSMDWQVPYSVVDKVLTLGKQVGRRS